MRQIRLTGQSKCGEYVVVWDERGLGEPESNTLNNAIRMLLDWDEEPGDRIVPIEDFDNEMQKSLTVETQSER